MLAWWRETAWAAGAARLGRVALAAGLVAACSVDSGGDVVMERAEPPGGRGRAAPAPVSAPPTTAAATTTVAPTTVPPTTAPPPPPPTTVPPTTVAPPAATARFTVIPYVGLGAWLDVYDWSATFTNNNPQAGVADIHRMADLGVQTVYIQASKWDSPTDVLEPERLLALIHAAHSRGMRVVAWYLPTLEDPASDLRRLLAVAALPVEGLAVDIEARNVADVAERNRRLVDLSAALRQHLPGQVLSAIVLPPVLMEDVNPNFWPGHPWAELAPFYDVWQPMAYWTDRRADSGWRHGHAYTAENIDRVRARIGRPDAIVHPVGGIGDKTTVEDLEGMLVAAAERGSIGGSIYDYRTTGDHLWPVLQGFRSAG